MIRENLVVGEGTKYPLNGMLTLPEDTGAPVPGVVLVHGSGSSNMDEKVGKLTPFKDLALKNRENVTFKLYENLNHVFVPSVYGVISKAKQEYNVEQHIGEDVISDIANWIRAVTE